MSSGATRTTMSRSGPCPGHGRPDVRRIEAEMGLDLIVIAVHVTGLDREEAKVLVENSDIAISCASKPVRDLKNIVKFRKY